MRLRSDNPVDELLEFARNRGVRHIVVGRSHKPWWRRMLGQSPVFKLVTEGFDAWRNSRKSGLGIDDQPATCDGTRGKPLGLAGDP